METRLAVFKDKQIRRTLHNNEWWFVIEDVVLPLIDSKDPKQYIQRMKQRDPELGKGWVQIVQTLSVETTGGTQRMLCANTEGIFRIIQSIPSPKAEPFKRWLGEAATTEISLKQDALGFSENKTAARKGGQIAGEAREKLEIETGAKVVSPENYLEEPESRKRLRRKTHKELP
jgi:prophage antirepressor-like protein